VEKAALIERLAARITELEALVRKPRKTSSNSHTPPSQDGPGRPGTKAVAKRRRKPQPSRPGVAPAGRGAGQDGAASGRVKAG